MKGRSQHRLPIVSDPPDDWGDGSWTVDCVCGVTFDDGEEMVNCDECGVWVHTRCSSFVKGEKSFACDKCKGKKGRAGDSSKETEVAQLLVELPTKTMRMDGRPAPVQLPPPFAPPRALYKPLWTEIPMEERVHVQGVPGGDPALFQGMSSVFSPQLWKCTGYVPKKFNFQYKEFSCWEDEEKDEEKKQRVNEARDEEEKENMVDRGADVLVSLSKEIIPRSPQVVAVGGLRDHVGGLRDHDGGGGCVRKLPPKEMKKRDWGKGGLSSGRMQTSVKRERNQLRPVGVPSGKRKAEELGASKERSGKKKSRSADKGVDNKKRGSAPAIDAHKLDIIECGDSKVSNSTDYQDTRSEDRRETLLQESNHEGHLEAPINGHEPNTMLFGKASAEVFCDGTYKHNISPDTLGKVENVDHQDHVRNVISPSVDASEALTEMNGIDKVSIKEEDVKTADDGLNHLRDESHDMGDLNGDSSGVAVDSEKSKPPGRDQRSIAQDMHEIHMPPDSNGVVSLNFVQTNAKSKIELHDGHATGDSEQLHSASDGKPGLASNSLQQVTRSYENISANVHVHDMPVGNLESGEHSLQDAERVPEAVRYHNTITEGPVLTSDEPYHCEQDSASPLTSQESCFKSRQGAKHIEEPLKLEATNPNPPAPSLHKLVVGIGKSVSSTIVLSKSSVPGNLKSMGTSSSPGAMKPAHFNKQRVKVKSSSEHRKDNVAINVPRDETKQEVPASVKNHPKSPANYGLKQQHASKIPHASISKHSVPDAEEQQVLCPSKASISHNVSNFSGTPGCSSLPQTQMASQNKPAAPSTSQKSEKINQSSSQSASKVSNHSSSVHPPTPVNASATLSDEELALLLHQELNSSPRVPRVPRIRHTGSLPQLSLPTATSMLAKRTSSSGGKDHVSVSRRKNKEEAGKDNSRNARELTDETRKANRFLSSPDQKRLDSVFATDGLTKMDSCNRSPETGASTKKNTNLVSSAFSNSGHSSSMEANDQTLSSIRSSPRDVSDDDAGGAAASTRTLPGLIDEIMSKGKRMTYLELCNAVLPHWQNLRKHNGERYAYSSHSQAVLDCLRNRNEWAQLVDRGPKTNSSRKRRKSDPETSVVDSESEDAKGRPSKQIDGKSGKSHEEFPKGKRKARKRRRLQLQGRVLKEVRKRQKVDATTDDDFGAYSSESSESIFSEDENMGAGIGEAFSSSSDETGGM